MKTVFFLLAASAPLLSASTAALNAGAITGRALDERGKAIPGLRIRLENRISGYRQTATADAQGRYRFFNVPFNEYHLEAQAPGFQMVHRDVSVRETFPIELNLSLNPEGATVVVEETVSLIEDHPSVHLDIDKSAIEQIPAAMPSRAMDAILLTTPGFIQDENGRFHFRGSHGQVMYVIDGVPVTDQMQAAFSNSMDAGQVESMEVITGGVSAEYGGKPGAVVNLTSKSGLGTPDGFEGDFAVGVSRFRTYETSLGLRGGMDHFGYFVTASGSESDRFLDPVNFENLHNHGDTGHLSSRFDWLLTDSDTLRLSMGGGQTRRDVVNLVSQEAAGQNQRAENTDANVSAGWTHLFSANQTLDASIFFRQSESKLDPSAEVKPGFTSGGADFPFWAKQDRSLDNQGALIAYTKKDGDNTFKTGIQYVRYPIHERFDFAITDQAQITNPADPLYPYTAAGGGQVFHFDEGIAPSLASAFIQDDLKAGNWNLGLGLRWDSYHGRDTVQNELQPRVGISYRIPVTSTVLRAVYDRLMITPENENLAFSTSQAAWNLTSQAGTQVPRLNPELQNSFLLGMDQQLGKSLRLGLDYWWKDSTNAADNAQFRNTGVFYPIAAAKGRFHGMDLRIDVIPFHGWSGYLSAGTARAVFFSPTVGGLSSADPGIDKPAGTPYLIDHDQKLTLQGGIRFEHKGFSGQITGRYDSGLIAGDPGTAIGNPDYDFGIPYVRSENDSLVGSAWRVRPRTVWNLSLGQEFKLHGKQSLRLGLDLLNAFDEKGLYNFLSTFGGTHVIPPRTFVAQLKYKF